MVSVVSAMTKRVVWTTDIHLNFLSAQAFAVAGVDPEDSWLVRKPLPSSAGGFAHLGGAIWSGRDDARVRLIEDWLVGAATCP